MATVTHQETPSARAAPGPAFDGGSDPISLRNILDLLRKRIWTLTIVTLLFTLAAIALTLSADDKFQASIIVSPVSDESGGGRLGGLASLASQLGGLSSLGISVPGNTQRAETVAILQSEALTERYIRENNLLSVLYKDKWDAARQAWKPMPAEEVPTLWKANQYFKRRVRGVVADSKTGLITMTINWRSPQQAAIWANGLVELTNDYLRSRAIEDSQRNIDYLKDQLAKTSLIGVQAAINSLLESEIKKAMLEEGSREYALKVIDPAVVPEKRVSPVPVLWILTGFLLGLSGSIVAIVLSNFGPMRIGLTHTPHP